MKQNIRYLPLLALLCTGCATLFNGPTDTVPVTTDPPGAAVAVSSENIAQLTPSTLVLNRNHDYELTITKEGYKTEKVKVTHVLSGAEAGNIIGFGILGTVIDNASGCAWDLKPDNLVVTLRPLSAGEAIDESERLNEHTLQSKLQSLERLKEANLLTENQYAALREITIGCVEKTPEIG